MFQTAPVIALLPERNSRPSPAHNNSSLIFSQTSHPAKVTTNSARMNPIPNIIGNLNFPNPLRNPNNHPIAISRGTSIASDSDNKTINWSSSFFDSDNESESESESEAESEAEAVVDVDVEVVHVASSPRVQTVYCSDLLSTHTVPANCADYATLLESYYFADFKHSESRHLPRFKDIILHQGISIIDVLSKVYLAHGCKFVAVPVNGVRKCFKFAILDQRDMPDDLRVTSAQYEDVTFNEYNQAALNS